MSWDLFIVQTNNCSTAWTCYVERTCCEYESEFNYIQYLSIEKLITVQPIGKWIELSECSSSNNTYTYENVHVLYTYILYFYIIFILLDIIIMIHVYYWTLQLVAIKLYNIYIIDVKFLVRIIYYLHVVGTQ